MAIPRRTKQGTRFFALVLKVLLLHASLPVLLTASPAPSKMKLRGYLTGRVDDSTVAILDDHIQLAKGGHVELRDSSSGPAVTFAGLVTGQLVEAEGIWQGKHQFSADRIIVEPGLLDKSLHESAYLQGEPNDGPLIAAGEPAELKADGEWLTIGPKTHREWPPADSGAKPANLSEARAVDAPPVALYAGRQVRYSGIRREDGRVDTQRIELHEAAPPEAYKLPHDEQIIPGKDPQSGIEVLEFRRGTKVDGRLKLFPVHEVQQYVADLGASLLPAGARGTTHPLEFRFFVVEDSSINAQALPDGTVLINTGLLGVVDNEAELAFAMSHEIAHVLQAHSWREANETRGARVGLIIAGIAGAAFVGDMSLFLSGLGMEAVVNGHQRGLENQADRLGLQTIIDRGYDPREATKLMRTIIERYGDRSTSKLWSNHDSSVLRGSFLVVQLETQYPQGHFDGARVDTKAFQSMRDAMGPVKID
ncbi:MAG: M48 family metalloprotease [Candidatus Acidiferrales bacterium]